MIAPVSEMAMPESWMTGVIGWLDIGYRPRIRVCLAGKGRGRWRGGDVHGFKLRRRTQAFAFGPSLIEFQLMMQTKFLA